MPMFENVSCSQCGESFGPGDHGFSSCRDHQNIKQPIKPAVEALASMMLVRTAYDDDEHKTSLGEHVQNAISEWFDRQDRL